MVIIVIAVLLAAIVVLIAYNIHIQKKIEAFNNINQKIGNLSVLQDFMRVAGEEESVDDKLNKINEIVIEKYEGIPHKIWYTLNFDKLYEILNFDKETTD